MIKSRACLTDSLFIYLLIGRVLVAVPAGGRWSARAERVGEERGFRGGRGRRSEALQCVRGVRLVTASLNGGRGEGAVG